MKKMCLVCGKEAERCICDSCRETADIDRLCDEVIAYIPGKVDNPNANPIWEEAAKSLKDKEKFSKFAYELADELPSFRREYQKIHSLAGEFAGVYKADRDCLLSLYSAVDMGTDDLSDQEKYRIMGLVLDTYMSTYRYEEAEQLASDLVELVDLPWQAYLTVADFYDKTRRYDAAEQILANAYDQYGDNRRAKSEFDRISQSCEKHKKACEQGGKEYIPAPKEDKDIAVSNYFEFMKSIGIDAMKPSKTPKPIPKEEYPEPVITDDADFDMFVAYDFETTGFSPNEDAIFEVGAVKVVNGEVVETGTFSELVKPYKKDLNNMISELTGITAEDLKIARQMWEVIPDFMEFVGDLPLVGYNNAKFDSRFLARAGRYSHIIIQNPNFDVLRYMQHNRERLGYKGSDLKLNTLAEYYGIENPCAHRACSDALTTAKVFLKIKEQA